MSKQAFVVAGGSALLLVALAHLACEGVLRTAPDGTFLRLIANPEFISANGGVSVITAILTEPAGTPVSNGTVVQFFTNLGRIDAQGRTTNGIARVNLVADSRSGTANVLALSGGPAPAASGDGGGAAEGDNSASKEVIIGNLNTANIFVTANPSTISLNGTSYITANVFDESGNPVLGAPVFFSLEDLASTPPPSPSPAPPSTIRDSLDSGGAAQFTDNAGRAFDVLHARRTVPGTVEVHARVPDKNGALLNGDVLVRIQ